VRFSIAPHTKEDLKLSEYEHLIASMQPRKYSKKTFKTEFQKKPKTTSEVLEMHAVLGYEELGGLSGIDPLGTARKLPVRKKKSDSY
jgi:hypothetical protein